MRPATESLYSQALAAFGATGSNNGAATACLHAGKKAVRACAFNFGGLVCTFHDVSSCLLEVVLICPDGYQGNP